MSAETQTVSRAAAHDPRGKLVRRHYLVFEVDCDRPLRAPMRFALSGRDQVAIGRGAGDDVEATVGGDARLSLRFPDGRMSGDHARLTWVDREWVFEDLGSKNGSFVNGQRADRVRLEDGDVVELGHTFLLYRSVLAPDAPEPPVVSARDLSPLAPGLGTLSVSLAAELAAVGKVAASPAPIVVLGETGTGKEVIARAIHAVSGATGKFVAVNCGALPRELVEAQLFGHRKGSFSGATDDRAGLVRSADRGTLFLDEIGDLPEAAQVALLRVLQEHEVVPVGESEPVPVDFRLVVATNADLAGQVAAGGFRADLYARIAAFTIVLPPLRERREDLGLLLGELLRRIAGPRADRARIAYDLARALLLYDWPRNIRELESYLTPALALAGDGVLTLEHFPEALASWQQHRQRPLTDDDIRQRLVSLLTRHRGNVAAVARELGKTRTQIHRLAKRFDIDFDVFRG